MKNTKNRYGMTIVELIVVITIMAILGLIVNLSYMNYTSYARDSVRHTDIVNIEKGLEVLRVKWWEYPQPDGATDITYGGYTLWNQWTFWLEASKKIPFITQAPKDPLTNNEYTYSVLWNGEFYQIGAMYETDELRK